MLSTHLMKKFYKEYSVKTYFTRQACLAVEEKFLFLFE